MYHCSLAVAFKADENLNYAASFDLVAGNRVCKAAVESQHGDGMAEQVSHRTIPYLCPS
ncbi:hypothetical protein MNR01_12540 [Lysobacter sp. S4-A87]|uniref:hypothetical protein n=1 Tax=Lysobacter sp. S4-A87 TaxID=2925843 RepID=UPI001F532AEA|nr:hypothetical protein [Lysobacter sp. S4-A87]UNK48573.1 hypothetical protein MNR01_12540 [Lysobacter sp. S4-A87]